MTEFNTIAQAAAEIFESHTSWSELSIEQLNALVAYYQHVLRHDLDASPATTVGFAGALEGVMDNLHELAQDEDHNRAVATKALVDAAHAEALAANRNYIRRGHVARGMRTAELNGWLHRTGKPKPGVLEVIRRQVLDELHGRALLDGTVRAVDHADATDPGWRERALAELMFERDE